MTDFRNPQKEAQEYIDANIKEPSGLIAYVLESSPPAINEPPLFADIPTQITGDPSNAITPTSEGGYSYQDFPELADFSRERWLGHYPELPPLPSDWPTKMEDAHRLAFGIVSEARKLANQKFGLRWVRGGFGTPFIKDGSGADIQIRMVDGLLVLQEAEEVKTESVTTLKAAGDFLGLEPSSTQREHDSPELGDVNRQLICDKETNDFLGEWFGLATSVLEELKLKGQNAVPVQIWPGHFDAAIELDSNKNRATFGASPGDANHIEPYFYIGPHIEVDSTNPFWNAKSFGGATLMFSDIANTKDQRKRVLEFCEEGVQLLATSSQD